MPRSLTWSQRERPLWLPPLVSVATLFSLFLTAMAVRRSSLATPLRPLMVALSWLAAAAIALDGAALLLQARARGLAAAVSGLVMLALGVMTSRHVLR